MKLRPKRTAQEVAACDLHTCQCLINWTDNKTMQAMLRREIERCTMLLHK